jgi:hypothetical protein
MQTGLIEYRKAETEITLVDRIPMTQRVRVDGGLTMSSKTLNIWRGLGIHLIIKWEDLNQLG